MYVKYSKNFKICLILYQITDTIRSDINQRGSLMALSLSKEQEKVKLSLQKISKNKPPPTQVKLLVDVSGSMKDHYKQNGYMLPILQQSIALASVIDPDNVVQIIAFDDKSYNLGDFGVNNFDNIWKEFKNSDFWNNTDYATGINEVIKDKNVVEKVFKTKPGFLNKLFGEKSKTKVMIEPREKTNEPNLVIFLTDGQNNGSHSQFIKAVNQLLDGSTYLMCIGSGGLQKYYQNLEQLADERGDVGYVYIENPKHLSESQFYDIVLSGELGEWLNQFSKPN